MRALIDTDGASIFPKVYSGDRASLNECNRQDFGECSFNHRSCT
jgi:hypothetical protein